MVSFQLTTSRSSKDLQDLYLAHHAKGVCGKNLTIINKSLYGLKTSAARFHEHLAELLLSLGFKKTKHDLALWMIDKASHYECLATYVDDILI
jgi:hypothetical protein